MPFETDFIRLYETSIREMWDVTMGGPQRTIKGSFVEELCELLVREAWRRNGSVEHQLSMPRQEYLIVSPSGRYQVRARPDKQVYIDDRFVLTVECKAYAETAMYKRVLFDSFLLSRRFPNVKFCLLQLESMLGGDYSKTLDHPEGSSPVHALHEFIPDIDIEVLTLLDGERRVKQEIHKRQFFKPLPIERVEYAVDVKGLCQA